MRSVKIQITGKVQGVFFRYYTKKKAAKLGISGYVKNEADGSVLVAAVGEDDKIDQLISWCRKGSPFARVDQVEVRDDIEPLEVEGFEIL